MSGLAGEHNDVVAVIEFGPEERLSTGTRRTEIVTRELWCNVIPLSANSDFLREAVDSSEVYRIMFPHDPELSFAKHELYWLTSGRTHNPRLRIQNNAITPQKSRKGVCHIDVKDITQDNLNIESGLNP